MGTISIQILSKIVGLNEISQHVHKYRRKRVSGPPMFGSGKDKENAAQKRRKIKAQEEDGIHSNVQLLFK